MSGIIGHLTYAILAHQIVLERAPQIARLISDHQDSYLAGAYLGADVMTLPGGKCPECGGEYGYGGDFSRSCPKDQCPLHAYTLTFHGVTYTPQEIHRMFYGRSHLLFGWRNGQAKFGLQWSQLPSYFEAAITDTFAFYTQPERRVAYVMGWISHVIGDALIKSVQPGLNLYLLNGTYTPQNRPIQDLFSFHQFGKAECQLDWSDLMFNLVETPVESVQAHFMRLTEPRGQLAEKFPTGWSPKHEQLLYAVMSENRRYQKIRNPRLVRQLALDQMPDGLNCNVQLSQITGGLSFEEMMQIADAAGFRQTLAQIGEAIAQFLASISLSE